MYSLLPYNTFGIDVSAARFLEYSSVEELKKLISGHLCRCTGYENILNAMERIVEEVYQISHKAES